MQDPTLLQQLILLQKPISAVLQSVCIKIPLINSALFFLQPKHEKCTPHEETHFKQSTPNPMRLLIMKKERLKSLHRFRFLQKRNLLFENTLKKPLASSPVIRTCFLKPLPITEKKIIKGLLSKEPGLAKLLLEFPTR